VDESMFSMKNGDLTRPYQFQATEMMAYPAKNCTSAKKSGDCQFPPTKREGGTIQNVAWTQESGDITHQYKSQICYPLVI